MKKVFFTKYPRMGASSRYRTFQYLDSLELRSGEIAIRSLFDDDYLLCKYKNNRVRFFHVLWLLVKRIWYALIISPGAFVFIENEMLPYFPALLERWLVWRKCYLVVDYDDAIFHNYDQNENVWVKRFLGGKISDVMRIANVVVVGNAYLADYARSVGACRVEEIPTVVDLERYPVDNKEKKNNVITIVWIGSPSTSRYLLDVVPALSEISKIYSIRVRLIGSGIIDLSDVPIEIISWREDSEIDDIMSSDIGIMPLPDDPWARGKCGLKLIQYMACGLPVVASPVGVNIKIVQHGLNGFHASTHKEWIDALSMLICDLNLRKRMGAEGRSKVEKEYSLQVSQQLWVRTCLSR